MHEAWQLFHLSIGLWMSRRRAIFEPFEIRCYLHHRTRFTAAVPGILAILHNAVELFLVHQIRHVYIG